MVIYKHEKDFLRTFDLEYFQKQLFDQFLPAYRNKSEVEKKAVFEQYMRAIEQDIDYNETQIKTADGYFVSKLAVKERNLMSDKVKIEDTKRKRKKKEKYRKDFYKFQLKSINDQKNLTGKWRKGGLGAKDGDEVGQDGGDGRDHFGRFVEDGGESEGSEIAYEDLDPDEYLKKRKERLKALFKDDVKKFLKAKALNQT